MKYSQRHIKHLVALSLALSLSACAVGGAYESMQVPPAQTPAYQVPVDATVLSADAVVANWWDALEDEQLGDLVDKALLHNKDIAIAVANLRRARTDLRGASLERLPSIGTTVSASEQRLADAAALGLSDTSVTSYQAGFDATWELDLFGRLEQQVNVSRAQFEATQAELDQAYVTVAAEVARRYIELRGAQLRLQVALRNVDILTQSAQMTQQLLEGGLGDNLDVQRARVQLELARANLPALRALIALNINRLSVLTGNMPATLNTLLETPQGLPSIPPSIAIGAPMELLKRRPDIRRADRQLVSAIAGYNVSVADMYPRVSISGSIGFLATAFADLGSGGTLTHFIGPQISWDALDLGRVRNRVDAADAQLALRLAQFEKTLLTSFEEVDNAMYSLNSELERQSSLRAAAEASAQSSSFAMQRFEAGSDSFLDLLDAQRTQLETEDQLARSEIDTALNVIALYKALGGGWELSAQ